MYLKYLAGVCSAMQWLKLHTTWHATTVDEKAAREGHLLMQLRV